MEKFIKSKGDVLWFTLNKNKKFYNKPSIRTTVADGEAIKLLLNENRDKTFSDVLNQIEEGMILASRDVYLYFKIQAFHSPVHNIGEFLAYVRD